MVKLTNFKQCQNVFSEGSAGVKANAGAYTNNRDMNGATKTIWIILILFVLMCVCVHEYVYLCGEQECPFPIQHVCSRGGASVQAFLFPFTYASQPLMSLYTTPILPPSPSRRPEFSPPE